MPSCPNEIEILLVEDNPDDAELAIRALKKHYQNKVTWVKDGADALDFVFARGAYSGRDIACTPKLILLDLRLPKVDGLEVLKIIKADERTKLIPVVVMTVSDEDSDIAQSYKLGVNSYFVKPMDFDVFMKVIGDLSSFWLHK